MSTTATESETERIVREEQEEHDRLEAEQRERRAGGDGQGKLVELPKITIVADDTDPSLLKVHFNGDIVIERGDARWLRWYNAIRPGKTSELKLEVFCSSSPRVHRRDKEGDVDAVAETKNLIVTTVFLDDETEAPD